MLGLSLAAGSGQRDSRGVGGLKQVLGRGVAGGQVLACGVGRWWWALVWATVSGEFSTGDGGGGEKIESRKGREEMAKSEEEPGLWDEVGSLGPEVAGTGWASGRATGVSMR